MGKKRRYVELNALKGLIREKKLSYEKVAAHVGIATNTFSDKVNGFNALSAPEMEVIAEVLEMDPEHVARYFMPTYLTRCCKTQHRTA